MEGMGVERIGPTVRQEVFGPGLKGGKGEVILDELHHHHGELELVPGAEIERSPLQDPVHRFLEILGPHECDEMAHLVEAIRGIEGAELTQLQGAGPVLGPTPGQLL
jgi:hypothetical protein